MSTCTCLATRKCTPQFADVKMCPILQCMLSNETKHLMNISKQNVSGTIAQILFAVGTYFKRNFISSDLSVVPD